VERTVTDPPFGVPPEALVTDAHPFAAPEEAVPVEAHRPVAHLAVVLL
jgi:hypothetical protein